MIRPEAKITNLFIEVLDTPKQKTERSKTKLVVAAMAILYRASQDYAREHKEKFMKRLDVNITNRLDDVLETLKQETERSKTELVHDAMALLYWARQVYARGHAVGEVDRDTATVLTVFSMPLFEGVRARDETQSSTRETSGRKAEPKSETPAHL